MPSELRRGFLRVSTSYARMIVTVSIGLAEVPILLWWLGDSAFGAVSLLGPSVGLASIVTEVVTFSLVRELGAAHHGAQNNADRSAFDRAYAAASLLSAVAAGVTALLFVGIAFGLLPLLEIDSDLRGGVLVYLAASAVYSIVRIVLAPPLTMIKVHERFDIEAATLILHRLGFLVTAVLLWKLMPADDRGQAVGLYGVLGYAVASLLVVATAAGVVRRSRRLLPAPWRARRADVRALTSTFGWSTAVTVATAVSERVPMFLVNTAFGLIGNTIYGIAYRLGAYARMITNGMTHGLESVATRVSSAEDRGERLGRLIEGTTRLNAAVAFPATVGLVVLADPLVRLWVGRSIEDPALLPPTILVAQIFMAAMGVRGVYESWIWILYGDGHVKRYAPLLIGVSLLLPLAVWAATLAPLGALAIAAPALLYLVLWAAGIGLPMPFLGARVAGVPVGTFLRPLIRPALATLPMAGALLGAGALLPRDALWAHAAAAAVSGVVYLPAFWAIVLTGPERARLAGLLRARLGRAG